MGNLIIIPKEVSLEIYNKYKNQIDSFIDNNLKKYLKSSIDGKLFENKNKIIFDFIVFNDKIIYFENVINNFQIKNQSGESVKIFNDVKKD